jgi:hypothetical protein
MNGDGMTEAQSERLVAAFERIANALERTYLPATLPSPSPLTSPFTPYELAPTYADGRRLTYDYEAERTSAAITSSSHQMGTVTHHHAREGEIR